jgi:vacuolar protein sorting-associated protein 13A/C
MGIHGTALEPEAHPPMLLSTLTDEKQRGLLDMMVETNPLDGECDTRLDLSTRPLEIIYDAVGLHLASVAFLLIHSLLSSTEYHQSHCQVLQATRIGPSETVECCHNLCDDFMDDSLLRIQQAAMEKMEDIREQTYAGLQYAIEQRKYTEITVNLMPAHVIIPEKGIYKK